MPLNQITKTSLQFQKLLHLIRIWNSNRVDLGVMAINRYSILFRAQEMEPQHLIQFSVILKTPLRFVEVLTLLRGNTVIVFQGFHKFKIYSGIK